MASLFGGSVSRNEILKHVGDISQIGGIRQVRLQDGFEDGVRSFEVRTGSGLEFDILADRGFDISRASFNGKPLAWRSCTSDQHPAFYDPDGLGWLRSFYGGLVVTCGLSQAGAPSEDEGKPWGLHGRISNTPAYETSVRQFWRGDEFILEARGKMREGVVFGENLTLERTITTALGTSSFVIEDTVTNEAFEPFPHMMLYHINIGYPAVAEGSQILAPSLESEPRDERARTEAGRWMEMRGPTQGFEERVYFHQMQADAEGFVTVGLVNPSLAGSPFGVWIKYRKDTLPHFSEWKMNGQGTYVCGLEPGNCLPMGRAEERRAGRLVTLEPGESRSYRVEIGVVDSTAALEELKRKASLED